MANMKPGRNDPCACGSGKKFKRCCGLEPASAAPAVALNPQQIGALVALVNDGQVREAETKSRSLLTLYPDAAMLWKILSVALMRQGKDALEALRKTTHLIPNDAEAHSNLGAALHDRGQWREALASFSRALTLQPNDVQALVDSANCLRAIGRAREAVAHYQRALQVNPRLLEAQNNLGNAFLELGEPGDAVDSYRRALTIKPDDALIHCNLGNALRQSGLLDEALSSSLRAIELDPASCVAHNSLGLVLAARGDFRQAVASYRRALALNAEDIDTLTNLGNALRDLGESREALPAFARAVELAPGSAATHSNLGNALLDLGRIDEAAASYGRALSLEPQRALAHVSLATARRLQGRAAEARDACLAALDIDPSCIDAVSLQGELQADRGQFFEAEVSFQRAIGLNPQFSFALFNIVMLRKMTAADADWLQRAQALLAGPLSHRHEINLHYALGKYFDDVAQYEIAFGHYRQANELVKRNAPLFDGAALTRRVDAIISRFDADFMRREDSSPSSQLPVFIIGMPRSGTSLTEQILASHPQIFGAGELTFWAKAAERDAAVAAGMADDYLARLGALSGGALRVIDKMPDNFLHAGLIHAALPQARFIHLQRHPIDTCLSIYFQNFFSAAPYSHDLEHLAHYYREYERIMNHWRAALPPTSLLEVPYEGLVEDLEGWTRRMLEFIGLSWDPRCLEFHQSERTVITSSKWQVKQKIHSASVGRWKNYAPYLGPLRHLTS
jgi:tetratricopeptide (TPR) repeat protein